MPSAIMSHSPPQPPDDWPLFTANYHLPSWCEPIPIDENCCKVHPTPSDASHVVKRQKQTAPCAPPSSPQLQQSQNFDDMAVIQLALQDPKLCDAAAVLLRSRKMLGTASEQEEMAQPRAAHKACYKTSEDAMSLVDTTTRSMLKPKLPIPPPPPQTNDEFAASYDSVSSPSLSSCSSTKSEDKGRFPKEITVLEEDFEDFKLSPCLGPRRPSQPTTALSKPHYKYRATIGGSKRKIASQSQPSLQDHFNRMLSSRNYSTKAHSSLECGYHAPPTPLQRASYGTQVLKAVQTSNPKLLKELLNCGLSRDPCNAFGDSVINMVCKRGDSDLFRVLVESGSLVRVADNFGRTPLHHAAWASGPPCFDTIEAILDQDVNLLRVTDKWGRTPLQYVAKNEWPSWTNFLDRKKEVYWPLLGTPQRDDIPVVQRCGSRHMNSIPDPDDALSVEEATRIAAGRATGTSVRQCTMSSRAA